MNADLTVKTPWKVLLKYTLPLFGGAVFQQLYTLADTIIAGRFAGQTALTAIGASNSIVNILMAFALGANAGCAVLAALFAAVCLLFAKPLIGLFMSQEEDSALALQSGIAYVTTIAPFYFIVNIKINADAVVRGCNGNVGFTVSTFSDLILRVAFVFILTTFLGFAGVGWAWAVGWSLGTVIGLTFYFFIPCLKKKNMNLYDEDGNLLPAKQEVRA